MLVVLSSKQGHFIGVSTTAVSAIAPQKERDIVCSRPGIPLLLFEDWCGGSHH